MSKSSEFRIPGEAPAKDQPEIKLKEILKPREAADYLSVHVRTLYRLVKNGDIPGRKVGGSWRFMKGALDEWLACKGNSSHPLPNPPPWRGRERVGGKDE